MKSVKTSFVIIALFLLSACTAQTEISKTAKEGNEGFVIGTGDVAVLLTHGFGASPYEVRGLAEYLAAKNLTIYAVRLAGHGTSVEDLAEKKWQDWYSSYREAYDTIKPLKKKVFVGGMSLGGVLALKLAEEENVDGVIALAPALKFDDKRTGWAWLLKYFSPYSSRVIPAEQAPYYYSKFPVAGVAEMIELNELVKKNLVKVDEPILIMQYREDYRASPESSQIVYDSVSSDRKQLEWINGTGHVFLLDEGKEKYFEQIYQFINANS